MTGMNQCRNGHDLLNPKVVPARPADIDRLATVVAKAIQPLRTTCWLVPDPDQRGPIMAGYATMLIEHAMTQGRVDTLTDHSAVAAWLDHTSAPPDQNPYQRRLTHICGKHADRVRAWEALLGARQPDHPHHRLILLAVTPTQRGQGRAGMLLDHHRDRLDAANRPGYAYAHCERSRNLLHRHGYQPGTTFALPNDTPILPMTRPTPSHHPHPQ